MNPGTTTLRLLLFALIALSGATWAGAQTIFCVNQGQACHNGEIATSTMLASTSTISGALLPSSADFGSCSGTYGSSGTINTPWTQYGGLVWYSPPLANMEGTFAFAPICAIQYGLGNVGSSVASCPASPGFQFDRLNASAFSQQLELVGNVQRWVMADASADPGDMTTVEWAQDIRYTLYRNSVQIAIGALSTKRVANPPSYRFDSLATGLYQLDLIIIDNAQGDHKACPNFMTTTFEVTDPADVGVNVHVNAFLQGPFTGSLMSDGLRSTGVLPTTEPYSALGYANVGSSPGTTVPQARLTITGNTAIVDWVVLELRSASTPSQVLWSKAALLQRNGAVVEVDGDTYVNFPVAAGSYHVALRHRNHHGVMTATPFALGVSPLTIPFNSNVISCYGTNARATAFSTPCLWAGDTNNDAALKYTGSANDRDPILLAVGSTTPNNVVSNAYDRRDTNLDGVIKYTGSANDRDIILSNVGSTTPNNTRTQQLP